jgi:hypothetical protein
MAGHGTRLLSISVLTFLLAVSPAAIAQEHHHHAEPEPETGKWAWTTDANLFFGFNYQQRKQGSADLYAWESQSWFMADGSRKVGGGRLALDAMFSLEPWTIGRWVYIGEPGQRTDIGGSPQLFQTGESYLLTVNGVENRIPLVNAQHPHDLFMGLGATYRIERGRVASFFGADLVGSPPLGPTAFMHRDSARDNPQVPLTHHYMDSTHISAGVVRAGITFQGVTLEAGVFGGEEPDEHRTNIGRPRLDSYAGRVSWQHGPWQAQFSGGHLHEPEWFEPYDVTRITASIHFYGAVYNRPLAVTAGWGENRQFNGFQNTEDGYLLEWDLRATPSSTIYGRGEAVAKELFGLAPHPRGFAHQHTLYNVRALTLGYVHDLPFAGLGRFGLGADMTVYRLAPTLQAFYAGSRSYHIFLRWRPSTASGRRHEHGSD